MTIPRRGAHEASLGVVVDGPQVGDVAPPLLRERNAPAALEVLADGLAQCAGLLQSESAP